ncbi:MAG TPA: hypothetical protein VGJ97_00025 [Anaerolineaceae bacterium]
MVARARDATVIKVKGIARFLVYPQRVRLANFPTRIIVGIFCSRFKRVAQAVNSGDPARYVLDQAVSLVQVLAANRFKACASWLAR